MLLMLLPLLLLLLLWLLLGAQLAPLHGTDPGIQGMAIR